MHLHTLSGTHTKRITYTSQEKCIAEPPSVKFLLRRTSARDRWLKYLYTHLSIISSFKKILVSHFVPWGFYYHWQLLPQLWELQQQIIVAAKCILQHQDCLQSCKSMFSQQQQTQNLQQHIYCCSCENGRLFCSNKMNFVATKLLPVSAAIDTAVADEQTWGFDAIVAFAAAKLLHIVKICVCSCKHALAAGQFCRCNSWTVAAAMNEVLLPCNEHDWGEWAQTCHRCAIARSPPWFELMMAEQTASR